MFLKNKRQSKNDLIKNNPHSRLLAPSSIRPLLMALSLAISLALSEQVPGIAQFVPDGMGANSSATDPDMEDLWHEHEPVKNNKAKLKAKSKDSGAGSSTSNTSSSSSGSTSKASEKNDNAGDLKPDSNTNSKGDGIDNGISSAADKNSGSSEPISSASLGGTTSSKVEKERSNTYSEDRSLKSASALTVKPGTLGSVAGFVSGDFIKTSTWPGFGPFKNKGESDNEFADDRENKLKLHAEGDDISAVEVLLKEKPATKQGFLNLQMVLDFAMEAVGMRPARISELNAFVEKNKERVTRGDIPVITTCGDYAVALVPTPQKDAIVIQLTTKESSVKHSALLPNNEKQEEPQWKEPTEIAAAVKPEPKINKPVNKKPKNTAKPAANQNPISNDSAANISSSGTTASAQNSGKTDGDSLKKELGDVIRSWQAIKKTAVKERQTEQLNKILSGAALSRQTKSIKWLAENKQYYDLTPEGVIVDKYTAVSQMPLRYSVYAKVKERSKLMPESGGKPIDEQETTYDVNYTLERVNDHWTISDSLIVKKNGDRTGQKTR